MIISRFSLPNAPVDVNPQGSTVGIPGDSDTNQCDHTGDSDSEVFDQVGSILQDMTLTVNPLGTQGLLTKNFSDVKNHLVCSPPGFTLTGA